MLVDTSIWVDHLRKSNSTLSDLLEAQQVYTHPFIIGELASGNLSRRIQFLSALSLLPQTDVIEHERVLAFVEDHRLSGRGLGWVDLHLLASAFVSHHGLWTKDKRLAGVANELKISLSN